MSIQSNLGAPEKSTLDNRQFLCSAALRAVTRLAKEKGGGGGGGKDEEQEDEEEKGDRGPVM